MFVGLRELLSKEAIRIISWGQKVFQHGNGLSANKKKRIQKEFGGERKKKINKKMENTKKM